MEYNHILAHRYIKVPGWFDDFTAAFHPQDLNKYLAKTNGVVPGTMGSFQKTFAALGPVPKCALLWFGWVWVWVWVWVWAWVRGCGWAGAWVWAGGRVVYGRHPLPLSPFSA